MEKATEKLSATKKLEKDLEKARSDLHTAQFNLKQAKQDTLLAYQKNRDLESSLDTALIDLKNKEQAHQEEVLRLQEQIKKLKHGSGIALPGMSPGFDPRNATRETKFMIDSPERKH